MTPTLNESPDRFEPCEQCGAPLDHKQRYCVNCAARRADPANPTSRYFAASSRRARLAALPPREVSSGSPMRAAAVAFLILLPAAVGIGVLVGRTGNASADNSALIAALKDQKLAAGTAAPTDPTALASSTTAVTSDFSLDKGYAVELSTLPSDSDEDAVTKAKDDAEGKGAKDVGVIVPADYTVTPDSGGDLVLYSGEFDKKADAEDELKKLKGDFSDAKVITVKAVTAGGDGTTSGGGGNADPKDGAGGELVDKGAYGDVHKVEGIQPTAADTDEGSQIAADQAASTGGDYIDGQKNLPDVIAVGEAP
jgi:hypothetical protein